MSAVKGGWRPIRTAPRNGSRIIVGWSDDGSYDFAWWYEGEWTDRDGHVSSFVGQPDLWLPVAIPPVPCASTGKGAGR
jgi:hypothetical protein